MRPRTNPGNICGVRGPSSPFTDLVPHCTLRAEHDNDHEHPTFGSWEKARGWTPPPARSKPLWVAVDLDDTLARGTWTPESPTNDIGELIEGVTEKIRRLRRLGFKIVIHTSRPWFDYERIESWLNHNRVPFNRIVCGKLWAAAYVDDRSVPSRFPDWDPPSEEKRLTVNEPQGDLGEAAWRSRIAQEIREFGEKLYSETTNKATGMAVQAIVNQAADLVNTMPKEEDDDGEDWD